MVVLGLLLFPRVFTAEEQPTPRDTRTSDQLFFEADTNLDEYADLWLAELRRDYDVAPDAAWQQTDIACTGRVMLAGQADHAGTKLLGFVRFDTRDSSALLYQPVITTTASDGSFTIRFKQMLPTRAKWAATDARIMLASEEMWPPHLRLFIKRPGYDGIMLELPFDPRATKQSFGSVELLPAGAHAARQAASFGGKGRTRFDLFDDENCSPQNILREFAADPTLATCDDAMFFFLTAIRQSGWGRQRNTNADFHEGFVAFRKHFMDGKDNTGQLMSMGIKYDDASWTVTFNLAEAEFYGFYLTKLFQSSPAKVIDLVSKNKRLLPYALPTVPGTTHQQLLAQTPEYEQILYTMMDDQTLRNSVIPIVGQARDRRAVPKLVAMLQEQPPINDQERRRIERTLAITLDLKGKVGRDRDWLAWWDSEGQHADWPDAPEPIQFEPQAP